MDKERLTTEDVITELTQGCTFHGIYAIICLYHLKPSKNIKKRYNKISTKMREDFEKICINQGLFERVNNTIVVTAKGIDFLMDNICMHVDNMLDMIDMIKEINETCDDDNDDDYEYFNDDGCDDRCDECEYYDEDEDNKENKVNSKNVSRQEKLKQKKGEC